MCHSASEQVRGTIAAISPLLKPVGAGHWIQVTRLGSKYVYLMSCFFLPCEKYLTSDLLSHLAIPIIVYLDYFQFFMTVNIAMINISEYKSSAVALITVLA